MIAEVREARIILDYTGWAPPLTITDLKDDCDELYTQDVEPAKIVLWQHQLDYIVKKAELISPVADTLRRGDHIWGYPLEVCE